jgi:catechol 2,3-dioxygenase-like lactoylglutathione lyase family enzyme
MERIDGDSSEPKASQSKTSRRGLIAMIPVLPAAFRDLTVSQVGILVPDLKAALHSYRATLKLDDWLVYTYSPATVPEMSYRGEPGQFEMRLAMSGRGPQIELIEPLAGPSVYHEWIERHGYGVQHLGFHVPELAVLAERLEAEGWLPVQTGRGYGVDGDGAFAYYDLADSLGLMLEVIELPATRRPSETIL